MAATDPIAAHLHSIRHREELLASELCGCFYCLEFFRPDEITSWVDTQDRVEQTALCPHCGIDSVIGSASNFPITRAFLEQMERHWFGLR